jgi:hypothetical protein
MGFVVLVTRKAEYHILPKDFVLVLAMLGGPGSSVGIATD